MKHKNFFKIERRSLANPIDKKLEHLKSLKKSSDERYERLIQTRPVNDLWRHFVSEEMKLNNEVTKDLLAYQHELAERKIVMSCQLPTTLRCRLVGKY